MPEVKLRIEDEFEPYVTAAITRFLYLFPSASIENDGSHVRVNDGTSSEETIRRDFTHLLYREKVYAETLDLRRVIYREFGRW